MPKIAVRSHASFARGMGHIFRQLHLGKVLRRRGLEVIHFIPDHPPSVEILKRENFKIRIVEEDEGFPAEKPESFDLVIVDLQDTQKEFIRTLRTRARKVVSFEDLGKGRDHVDLLIDSNLKEEKGSELSSRVKTLFGLSYSVLASEFAAYHSRKRDFPPTLESVLVSMGGTDPNQLTERITHSLLNLNCKTSITIVAGPGFKNPSALERLASFSEGVRVLTNITSLADPLFSHNAVLCSGGVTLHEALAVGTPAFVLSQAPHQEKKAQAVVELGAAINLGLAENFDPHKLSEIIVMRGERLQAMSQAGKKVMDGRGIDRVADEIQRLAAEK